MIPRADEEWSEGPSTSRPDAAARGLWKAWPWITWLLAPVLIFFRISAPSAGWGDAWMAILYAPWYIPLGGLLGSLPRLIMRKRGWRSVPRSQCAMLLTHWWACVFFVGTLPGHGDVAGLGSVIGDITGMSASGQETVNLLARGAIVLCWICEVTIAATISPRSLCPGEDALPQIWIVGVGFFLLVPLVFLQIGNLPLHL